MKSLFIALAAVSLTACSTQQVNKFVCYGAGTCGANERFAQSFAETPPKSLTESIPVWTAGISRFEECKGKNTERNPISDSAKRKVIERYKELLKDPYSAHFRNISERSEFDHCIGRARYVGEVNAKNSYGGYTGYQIFSID